MAGGFRFLRHYEARWWWMAVGGEATGGGDKEYESKGKGISGGGSGGGGGDPLVDAPAGGFWRWRNAGALVTSMTFGGAFRVTATEGNDHRLRSYSFHVPTRTPCGEAYRAVSIFTGNQPPVK